MSPKYILTLQVAKLLASSASKNFHWLYCTGYNIPSSPPREQRARDSFAGNLGQCGDAVARGFVDLCNQLLGAMVACPPDIPTSLT